MPDNENPIEQLSLVLKRWEPSDKIDILGIILDFCQRTNKGLLDVFNINPEIYPFIFLEGKADCSECLTSILLDEEESVDQIKSKYKHIFPKVLDLISKKTINGNKDVSIGRSIEATNVDIVQTKKFLSNCKIIWQLSDIHFGKLNTWKNEPEELASALAYCQFMVPEAKPDYIVVSGDISSIADVKEFDLFKKFCKELSAQLWGSPQPYRFFLIPGNHEVHWSEDGNADKLERFAENFSDNEYCITPFGEPNSNSESPNVEVERFGLGSSNCPPFAIVRLKDLDVNLVLLVSSFHSGQIPKEVKDFLDQDGMSDAGDRLKDILREDEGQISQRYLSLISRHLEVDGTINIGVMHHHSHTYGTQCATNPYGQALLETLWKKNCRLLLHGHLHMFEKRSNSIRSLDEGASYCIPCSTLSSHAFVNTPGFLMHCFDLTESNDIVTYKWELSQSTVFSEEFIEPSYITKLYQPSPTASSTSCLYTIQSR